MFAEFIVVQHNICVKCFILCCKCAVVWMIAFLDFYHFFYIINHEQILTSVRERPAGTTASAPTTQATTGANVCPDSPGIYAMNVSDESQMDYNRLYEY